jgi:hypothetical protein
MEPPQRLTAGSVGSKIKAGGCAPRPESGFHDLACFTALGVWSRSAAKTPAPNPRKVDQFCGIE